MEVKHNRIGDSMPAAGKPLNEQERLKALKSYEILDTVSEDEYDSIVKLASHICNTPIALISLVDEDRQWFKAKVGLDASETHRDLAFCAHAILNPSEPLIVEDATQDSRFKDNPLVLESPSIRFYAGYPLNDEQNNSLGTLCVIDKKPHKITATQHEALTILSHYVVSLMQLRRHRDSLQKMVDEQVHTIVEALAKAEKASKLKSEFLSNISHELRTPLHGIKNLTRLCEESIESNNIHEALDYLHDIDVSGDRMVHLVGNLLDLSKLEAGSTKFDFSNFEVIHLIKTCIAEMKKKSERKNISIRFHESSSDAMSVVADYAQLKQVMLNLLSNAIKFSPEGGKVEITYGVKNNQFSLSISDNGCGIPEEEKVNIFDDFIQGSHTKTGAGGTGLGLAICRQIIAGHNGKIWAENKSDASGAVFSFTIPSNLHSD